ncbi:uncharacterized protein LOC141901625 isoform X2 [Tubulanus polymorphus]|uniref:uncharacterized protein LOC141901625 isoform X2 n=1 Tax=Tubulanus polymorphus TaxID=672921 RepID=UPI003DA5CFA5
MATVVRQTMSKYWREQAIQGTSVKEMMLDNDADDFADTERKEIMNLLPDVGNKVVLELGAGIGRFTSEIAKTAKSVIAVDFMEQFIETNKGNNGHLENVSFMCADVMQMDIPKKSIDVLFSNWLFMYISDSEICRLVPKMLSWLKDDGYFFYRESCFHQSGTKARKENPTRYRSPTQYNSLMLAPSLFDPQTKTSYCFELIDCTSVKTYIEAKSNRNQIVWLLRKTSLDTTLDGYLFVRLKLDEHMNSEEAIARYQTVYGAGFLSSGGIQVTRELTRRLNLKQGDKVLDIGCCPGGTAQYLGQHYGIEYLGLHNSSYIISLARKKADNWHDNKIEFVLCNETAFDAKSETFDAIYSREYFMNFSDKISMLKKTYNWLKPGGRLVMTDITRGKQELSFSKFLAQRGFYLYTVESYKKGMKFVGFENVKIEDETNDFTRVLRQELTAFENKLGTLKQRFGEPECQLISDGWRAKIERCEHGIQGWVIITATKPI